MSDTETFGGRSPPEIERRITNVIDEMTVEEMVGQLVGIPAREDVSAVSQEIVAHHLGSCHFGTTPHNTPERKAKFANEIQRTSIEASRFDVPLFLRAMAEHGHAAIAGSTVFPQQLGLAATRNAELVARCASVTASELRATGVHSTSSPIGDVARDQRWGRIAETFGESPELCASLVRAMVEGYQKGPPSEAVHAVTKHFPAYSEPYRGEDQAPNELSEYVLRLYHLPPYRAGIDAGTSGIMPCYNAINGEPVHGSARYLHELLREELGFDGFVLADYAGAEDLHGGHNTSSSLEESLWQSIRAGIDLFPSGGGEYAERIVTLVRDDELSESRIETSARRILRLKFDLGLFEDPFVDEADAIDTLGRETHREVAREAARESMTLLKNENDLLPLPTDLDRVFVTGPNVDEIAHQHGGWGHVRDPRPLGDTVLEGIRDVAAGTNVEYEPGTTIGDPLDVDAAGNGAADSDVAIVVLGEPDYVHEFREGPSELGPADFPHRESITLPDAQRELVRTVHDSGTPTIVVLVTGRVLATPWIAEHVPAVLLAYQPGSEGAAVADVLFGRHNPSGKLPISIPRSEGQIPVRFNYLDHPTSEHPAHLPSYDPLYEYGHGLSYTEFVYERLSLSEGEIGPGGTIDVEVTVANVGDRVGSETVEVFIKDVVASRITPAQKLVAFERVDVEPGERERVSFTLDPTKLGLLDRDGGLTVEPGTFRVTVEEMTEEFDVVRRRPYAR